MKANYCLRCAQEIQHLEPRLCRACAGELRKLFDAGEHLLATPNFDQACVECGEYQSRRLLHGPGEFTWCEPCVEAGLRVPEPE